MAVNAPTNLLFSLTAHPLAHLLQNALGCEEGRLTFHNFPDGETSVRIQSTVTDRQCIVLADLVQPNAKFLPLIFLLETLRELQAQSVGLLIPYLPYMRQDRRFRDGEAITSRIFAKQLSSHTDWLVTVDPHLHRYHALEEIYSIPTQVVQGAPAIAKCLKQQSNLFLVGPDAESEQWVAEIAANSGHPFIIGNKKRFGDRNVEISLGDLSQYKDMTAVIIDDVISSGQTILQCLLSLQQKGITNIKCAAVHGIFADNIDKTLLQSGLQELITTNTIPHNSNTIDITEQLIQPIKAFLKQQRAIL